VKTLCGVDEMKPEVIIFNSKDKKQLKKILVEQFDIEDLQEIVFFCLNSKEKIYMCNRECFDVEHHLLRVNAFGNYFGTFMPEGFRLSIEGSQIIGPLAKKNVFHISQSQRNSWLHGEELLIDETLFEELQGPYVLICYNNDFFGCGKVKDGRVLNYLPKSRMVKNIFSGREKESM
jgi:NOL1/NOP2/fmu family ribosome biogenesis protein